MELTTELGKRFDFCVLFMMSKIQNLNGTHNCWYSLRKSHNVVYDVKDTKFEWNSQHTMRHRMGLNVVYDVKDTKFEWNSQLVINDGEWCCGCL